MDLVCPKPIQTSTLVWQPSAGTFALTIVCKLTFRLVLGMSTLVDEGERIQTEDVLSSKEGGRTLFIPTDLTPNKIKADVVLVGSAYLPNPAGSRTCVARMQVGSVNKSCEVSVPAGPQRHAPCLAFGPVAPTTAPRAGYAGSRGAPFPPLGASLADQPIPPDMHARYFNVAPLDQQVDLLPNNIRIVLEHLHPQHARFVTGLPAIDVQVSFDRGRGGEPVAMRADTLWIDTDRQICTLTLRGSLWLAQRNEVGRIRVTMEERTQKPTSVQVASGDDMPTIPPPKATPVPPKPAEETIVELSSDEVHDDVWMRETLPPNLPNVSVQEGITLQLEKEQNARVTLPFIPPTPLPPAPAAPLPTAPAAPLPAAPPMPAAPIMVIPPVAVPKAPRPSSPWSGGAGASNALTKSPPMLFDSSAPAAPTGASVIAKGGGVLAASNVAAGVAQAPKEVITELPADKPKPPADSRGTGPKGALKVLYFDPTHVERIRTHTEWRVILAELALRLLDDGQYDDEPANDAVKAKRDVEEVLLGGDAIAVDGIRAAYASAMTMSRCFEAPLVLVQGELELPFDELSVLKATVAAIRPISTGDKRLTEVLDTVEELSKTPWLDGSSGIASGLLERVREAFGASKRAVSQEYLELHTERMLLERRCYQTRSLWGKKWIRGILRGNAAETIPTYVPEALREELPMFKRFRVKMITEVEAKEDQYETSAYGMKVLALGRIVGLV